MKPAVWVLASILLVICLMPVAGAIHGPGQPGRAGGPPSNVLGQFEANETAVRPGTEIEVVLVLETRGEPSRILGTVESNDDTTARHESDSLSGAGPGGRQELLQVDVEMEPFSTHRIPFTVSIPGAGQVSVRFLNDPESEERVHVDSLALAGLSPIAVSLDAPGPNESLVSLPGAPARLTVTLTALPGSNITDLYLSSQGADLDEIEIGDLVAGESRTVTVEVVADDRERFRSVDRSAILPMLRGNMGNLSFSHPLYSTHKAGFEPIHPPVYIARNSVVFIVPPLDPHIGVPTTLDLIVLNAENSPVRARGEIELSLPGIPDLDTVFSFDKSIAAGSVETSSLDWTPSAAGPWETIVRHNLGDQRTQRETIHVAGPIAGVDFQVPGSMLARGAQSTISVVVTSSQAVELDGILITTTRAPLQGLISIHDLFTLNPIEGVPLTPEIPAMVPLTLTPIATGSTEIYLVAQTSEGLSVHGVGTLTVSGSMSGWTLPWTPTIAIAVLLVVHFMWRRRWVQ